MTPDLIFLLNNWEIYSCTDGWAIDKSAITLLAADKKIKSVYIPFIYKSEPLRIEDY